MADVTPEHIAKLLEHFDVRLATKDTEPGRERKVFLLRPKVRNTDSESSDAVLAPFRHDANFTVHNLPHDTHHGTRVFQLMGCRSVCNKIEGASKPVF
jgi:hypothetical protein